MKEWSADPQSTDEAPPAAIGSRQDAEEALLASEQRLQDILDQGTALVSVKDLRLRHLLVNREYERRFHVHRDQIRGKTDFDIHPHDVAEMLQANDQEVIDANSNVDFRIAIPTSEDERHYAVVKFPLRDRSEKPYAVCCIATDITELRRAEEIQARAARRAALRADISATFSAGAEGALTNILQRTAEAVVRHLDAAFARIWTLNDRLNMLELQASAGLYTHLDGEHARIPVGKLKIGFIAQERKPHLTNDVQNDKRISHPEWAKQEGLVAFAGYPLLVEGRLVGVLAMFSRRRLGQDILAALEMVAHEIAQNIDRKRAEEKLRKRSEQVQKHRDVLLGLAHSDKSDFANTLRKICAVSAAALSVARVSYWSLQESGTAIACEVLHLRHTESFHEQCKASRLCFADCPAYLEALAKRRPIVADSALEHPAMAGLVESYLKPLGISALLHAPVWIRGEMVGVLCHEDRGSARHWSAEEIDFVSTLGATVSLALEESNRARSELLLRESEARLRESEERFSTAFRVSPLNITILRLSDARFVEANDAFVRWFGLDRDKIIGHDTRELNIWPNLDDRAKFLADLRSKGSLRDVECRLRSRRGTIHTLLQSAEIIEINREPHMLVVGLDITQRKQAEEELLRTLAREKELGRLRSEFISMVSHEFRTPLGIIHSSAEILEDYLDRLEPAERKDHLQSIRKNARRMAGLMEEVLLLGSLDGGKMRFKPAPLELRTFVERLVDEVSSATKQRCPIQLSLAEAPSEIHADERLLRHIFTNLLTNAIKYSDVGLTVRFEIESGGAEIVCSIRDQGIGIPEADQEWLFTAFHRGHNVADRPGTGLGLVIVKRCVDLHGGKIKVESQFGEGTTVKVRLPVSGKVLPAAGASPGAYWA